MENPILTVDLVLGSPGFDQGELQALLEPYLSGKVELVIADPGFMRVMNMKYRHVDRSTDVLAFDLRDEPGAEPEGVIFVDGRVFPPMGELLERIFHGYLHLTGRTHDTPEDRESMNRDVTEMVARALEGSGVTA
jgi:ssRNA-specific RNase YbeY (16S rRNA maturation enzyme)